MTDPWDAARAVADAMLAGDWVPAAMAARARTCLGGVRWRFLTAVAEAVRHEWPSPPLGARREVAEFVEVCEPWVRGVKGRDLRVVRRYFVPSVMGPARWPVLPLAGVGDVARWLGLTVGELAWFADVRGRERRAAVEPLRHYRYRWVGGRRLLEVPKPRLRDFQRRLLRDVLSAVPPHDAAHGFRAGRSVLTHARGHVGRPVVVRFDLEGFFASVPAGRVYGVFRAAGYPEAVAHVLTGLTTNVVPRAVWEAAPPVAGWRLPAHRRLGQRLATPHLPQGAPTSPALANLAALGLDRRLAGLAAAMGLTYSRYADDLAFSGDGRLGRLEAAVARIVADEGFRINEYKTGVATAAARQHLCGVVVNERPNVRREDYERLKAVLHNCVRDGPAAHNRDGHRDFRAHLLGRVAWVAAVHPERGARLRAEFDRIEW